MFSPEPFARRVIAGAAALVATLSVATATEVRVAEPAQAAVTQTGVAAAATPAPSPSKGAYASVLRHSDGGIDIPATVAKLRTLGTNRYYYLLEDPHFGQTVGTSAWTTTSKRPTSWSQLPAFADAARAAGIDVVVYLVPPTESSRDTYTPYGWDYAAWGDAIGKIAAAHPAVKGIAIDDFGANSSVRVMLPGKIPLSPAMMTSMRARARVTAPWMKTYALLYGQDFYGHTSMLGAYRSVFDGVIYAFAGPNQILHAPQNTTDSRGVGSTTQIARRLTGCRNTVGRSCWQAWFPAPVRGSVSTASTATADYRVQLSAGSNTVELWLADDRDLRYSEAYTLYGILGAAPVFFARQQFVNGWTRYRATLASARAQTANLRLAVGKPTTTRMLTVYIDDVKTTAGPSASTASSFTSAGNATSTPVGRMQLVLMAYCSRLGSESGIAGAADSAYVTSVLAQALEVRRAKGLDGFVGYRVNVTGTRPVPDAGDPLNFSLVRAAASAW